MLNRTFTGSIILIESEIIGELELGSVWFRYADRFGHDIDPIPKSQKVLEDETGIPK